MNPEQLDQFYQALANPKNLCFFSLVALGMILKAVPSRFVPDWTIPLILGATGTALGVALFGGLPGGLMGFVFAAVSVYGHQIINQFVNRNGAPK